LAGEIKDVYPKKPVTIVQGPDGLFHDAYPAKFRKAMGNSVAARGIDVVYKDYIDEFTADFKAPEGFVTTRNGKKIDADLVVPTRGGKPNTAFLKEGSGIVLNQHGQIPVEATLQVKGHRNIFAMGDAIDLKEQKQVCS
jgi:NADH dehydrogenase FAD-containing subunit